jgi:Short C-terminal domain
VFMRRRRPLLRAAMVGGGAYYAGKRAREREEQDEWQDARIGELESQQAAPPPQSGGGGDMIEQLTKLGQLHEQGVLTDAEFEVQKQKLLQGA